MPIYEYKCKKCNEEFELLLYSGEVAECPKCKSKELIKKMSLFNSSCGYSEKNSSDNSTFSSSSCGSCSGNSCSTCR